MGSAHPSLITIKFENTAHNTEAAMRICWSLDDNFNILPTLKPGLNLGFTILLGETILLEENKPPTPGEVIDLVANAIEGKSRDFVIISEPSGALPVLEACSCTGGPAQGTTCCVVTKYEGPR